MESASEGSSALSKLMQRLAILLSSPRQVAPGQTTRQQTRVIVATRSRLAPSSEFETTTGSANAPHEACLLSLSLEFPCLSHKSPLYAPPYRHTAVPLPQRNPYCFSRRELPFLRSHAGSRAILFLQSRFNFTGHEQRLHSRLC